MRLTDHRYSVQRQRLEIALRMLLHEARTATIRECTGISEDRIRKLHRSYFGSGAAASTHRRRGKSPHQPQCLLRNLQVRTDAGLLAGLLISTGVLSEIRDARSKIDCDIGARICDAYELFLRLRPSINRHFSFEHAWFLVKTLAAGVELAISRCPRCSGAMLYDRYAPRRAMCPLCEAKRLAEPRPPSQRRRSRTSAPSTGSSTRM